MHYNEILPAHMGAKCQAPIFMSKMLSVPQFIIYLFIYFLVKKLFLDEVYAMNETCLGRNQSCGSTQCFCGSMSRISSYAESEKAPEN